MSLPSWNEGPARSAVLDYLERVTTAGGPDHVPAAERIAVLDNDGTLWCEKPAYLQVLFILERLRDQAAHDPRLAGREVVQALLAGDVERASAAGMGELASVLVDAHAGLTTDEFAAAVAQWLEGFRHPRFGVPFSGLVYVPMLELIELLRAHEFRVFVVTGGGVEFVRAVSEEIYGVMPDDVIGTAVQVRFERRDGRVVLVREARLLGSPNEGEPKPVNIQAHLGRRPILAAGNSAGDREMLEYAHTGDRASLCLVIDHDDAEREYAYESRSVTDPHAEPISATAAAEGWTVVSMRDDWSRVFATGDAR